MLVWKSNHSVSSIGSPTCASLGWMPGLEWRASAHGIGKGKGKRGFVLRRVVNTPLNTLRYGTHFQGISQFYLHTPCSSASGMNHICFCLPSWSWYSFTDAGGMEGWVGFGWLVGYIIEINVRHRELNPDMVAYLSTNRARRRLTSLIKAIALTTMPDHQDTVYILYCDAALRTEWCAVFTYLPGLH